MINNKKRLTINLVANVLSYSIATILSFLVTPYLVNHLGKEIYGFYGIANNFVNYITIISVALNSMAAKFITVELVRENDDRANGYFTSIFFSNIFLCLILTPLLVLLVFNLRYILTISDDYVTNIQVLFALVFGAMIIRFLTSIFGCATYASDRTDLQAYTEMGKSLLRLALYVLLFAVFKPSIVYVGIVLFLLELMNSLIQIILSKKLLPNLRIKRESFDIKLVFSTLKIGIWNSINQLGDLLLSSSDLIAANILLGESASGNISIVKTMPVLISGVITAINSVFLPRFTHRYGENDKERLVSEVQFAQKIMGAIVTPIVILIIVFGYDFFSLWVPGNDIDLLARLSALDISRMLIIGVVWPVFNLNIIMDRVKYPSMLVLGSGALNVLSMILLTQYTSLGIYAILLTTVVITILFYGLFIPFYPTKELSVPLLTFFKPLLRMLVASVVIVLCIYPIHAMLEIKNWIHFFIYGGLCAVVAFSVSVLIFVGPMQLCNFISNKKRRNLQ